MKRGDIVQLKTPIQGRLFRGKLRKEVNGCYQVDLPNGLYATYPIELWELYEESNDSEQISDDLVDDLT